MIISNICTQYNENPSFASYPQMTVVGRSRPVILASCQPLSGLRFTARCGRLFARSVTAARDGWTSITDPSVKPCAISTQQLNALVSLSLIFSRLFTIQTMSDREPTRWQHNRIYPHPINTCVYTYDSICHLQISI